jgi:RNA polymerase sigma-70 factor (ECF subfamily)
VDAAERAELEAELRRKADAGDHAGAATAAITRYGPEIYSLLVELAGDRDTADETFAAFCADIWRDLPRFRWACTFRTWAYRVSRHKLYRVAGRRRRDAHAPLSGVPEVDALAVAVRTATQPYLRTETKDAFAALRARLEPDDRLLLILRVDRDLEWREIARVLGGAEAALDRDAAALRKRFERVKARLRKLAEEAGLFAS